MWEGGGWRREGRAMRMDGWVDGLMTMASWSCWGCHAIQRARGWNSYSEPERA